MKLKKKHRKRIIKILQQEWPAEFFGEGWQELSLEEKNRLYNAFMVLCYLQPTGLGVEINLFKTDKGTAFQYYNMVLGDKRLIYD